MMSLRNGIVCRKNRYDDVIITSLTRVQCLKCVRTPERDLEVYGMWKGGGGATLSECELLRERREGEVTGISEP